MTNYYAEIDIEITATCSGLTFKDEGVLVVKFDHEGGIFHDGGMHPDDQPHHLDIKTAIIELESGSHLDGSMFFDVERLLLSNQDKWQLND